MKKLFFLFAFFFVFVSFSDSSHALGPVDGEIGVALWANDFDTDLGSGDIDAGSLMIYGETWIGEKWGIRGSWFDSDFFALSFMICRLSFPFLFLVHPHFCYLFVWIREGESD